MIQPCTNFYHKNGDVQEILVAACTFSELANRMEEGKKLDEEIKKNLKGIGWRL